MRITSISPWKKPRTYDGVRYNELIQVAYVDDEGVSHTKHMTYRDYQALKEKTQCNK
jgi:hypothetical protein